MGYWKPLIIATITLLLGLNADLYGSESRMVKQVERDYRAKRYKEALVTCRALLPQISARNRAHILRRACGAATNLLEYKESHRYFVRLKNNHQHYKYLSVAYYYGTINLYYLGRYKDLRIECRYAQKTFPSSSYQAHWILYEGISHHAEKNFPQAASIYRKFLILHRKDVRRNRVSRYLREVTDPPSKSYGVLNYQGQKYKNHLSFRKFLRQFPNYLKDSYRQLHKTLGIDPHRKYRILIEFKDRGREDSSRSAYTSLYGLPGRTIPRITFYAEPIVSGRLDPVKLVAHELKHAVFRQVTDFKYAKLPKWIKEGLAVYGAGQGEDRVALHISLKAARGQDPEDIMNGLEKAIHLSSTYAEGYLAFKYLDSIVPQGTLKFSKEILKSRLDYQRILETLTGLKYAEFERRGQVYGRREIEGRTKTLLPLLVSAGRYYSKKKYREAEAILEAGAKEKTALQTNFIYLLGKTYYRRKKYTKAMAQFNWILVKGVDITTYYDNALYWTAVCLYRLGRNREAQGAFERYQRDFPEKKSYRDSIDKFERWIEKRLQRERERLREKRRAG